jgi:hypothetical protein
VNPWSTAVPLWRRLAAGALGLSAAATLAVEVRGSDRWKIALPVGALVAAAGVVHLGRLGPQLLARAVWWANLVLGTILCVFGGSSERADGLLMALACGAALLAIGGKGLVEGGERAAYAPATFRGSLLLLMVLALADAQTLLLIALLSWDKGHPGEAVLLGAAGLALAGGFVGLYRIQVWGALVNVAVCGALLLIVIGGALRDHDFWKIVGALSVAHLAAAAPLLASRLLGPPAMRVAPRVRRAAAVAIILGLMGLSALARYRLIDLQ